MSALSNIVFAPRSNFHVFFYKPDLFTTLHEDREMRRGSTRKLFSQRIRVIVSGPAQSFSV